MKTKATTQEALMAPLFLESSISIIGFLLLILLF